MFCPLSLWPTRGELPTPAPAQEVGSGWQGVCLWSLRCDMWELGLGSMGGVWAWGHGDPPGSVRGTQGWGLWGCAWACGHGGQGSWRGGRCFPLPILPLPPCSQQMAERRRLGWGEVLFTSRRAWKWGPTGHLARAAKGGPSASTPPCNARVAGTTKEAGMLDDRVLTWILFPGLSHLI